MTYLCLVYRDAAEWNAMPRADDERIVAGILDYRESPRQRGQFIDADAVRPGQEAVSVRVRQGDAYVTDGPFVETKEQLGGFYLFQAADLGEAIQAAPHIPSALHATLEIRPLKELEVLYPREGMRAQRHEPAGAGR